MTDMITVRSPDGTTIKMKPGESRSRAPINRGFIPWQSGRLRTRFAVNLPPEEGRTAPMAWTNWKSSGCPQAIALQAGTLSKAVQAQLQAARTGDRQKLWRWLIIGALIVIMAETWLAGRLSRTATLEAEVKL